MNEYGLDVHYFKKKLNNIVQHLEYYSPEEIEREFIILARVAQTQYIKPEITHFSDVEPTNASI